jgi:hypothetical protein
MQTSFRITPESKKPLDFDIEGVNASLPHGMHMEKRDDGVYIVVATPVEEDEDAQQLVQRELDRIFFLTCVRASAEMSRRRVCADLTLSYRIHGELPVGLGPQDWGEEDWGSTIALRLRLWSVAVDIADPPTQLLIFFQIIELAYPDTNDSVAYPIYTDATRPPHPRTEAKLLRHLVSHAGQAAKGQTQKYLQFLGLEPVMANRSDPTWLQAISAKVNHVRQEAYAVIKSVITSGQ